MNDLATTSYVTWLAPLAGAVLIGLGGTRVPRRAAGWIALAAMLIGFVAAVLTLLTFNDAHPDRGTLLTPWTWLHAGDFTIGLDLFIDALSILEMLVVTGVGFLITVYSMGYMAGDDQERRFMAYMNLFAFSMLTLVMGGNIAMLLVGWGLVGMASYLLIGFWHDRPSAVAAAKKAFVINAIGDVFLMLAVFLVFAKVGALSYPDVFDRLPQVVDAGSATAVTICLLLLGGALAKSAQLPLHTWLPDAMEGPTPVSALIHAATMVTAGVYLVARMWPVFDLSEGAQMLVAGIGAVTLVFAGFVALAQTDIKRVIAYSTMSQIGYMFLAVGIGAYSAGMFHLVTHAFFKALLFLAAGIVIHALADEQDVRQMGGLRSKMPKTWALFLIGSLALAGIIPLSGFFSKDEILAFALASADGAAFGWYGYVLYGLGMLGVVLTGLYSFRLFFLVFHGEEGPATKAYGTGHAPGHGAAVTAGGHGGGAHGHAHAHAGEAPLSMMWPVMVLGVLSVVGGLLVVPGQWNVIGDFLHLAESAPTREALHEAEFHGATLWLLALLVSLPIALIGIFVARQIWLTGTWSGMRSRFPGAERRMQAAMGWDTLYDRTMYRPASFVGNFNVAVEREVTGPTLDVATDAVRGGALVVARSHTGLVRLYAFGTALGAAALVVAFLLVEYA